MKTQNIAAVEIRRTLILEWARVHRDFINFYVENFENLQYVVKLNTNRKNFHSLIKAIQQLDKVDTVEHSEKFLKLFDQALYHIFLAYQYFKKHSYQLSFCKDQFNVKNQKNLFAFVA